MLYIYLFFAITLLIINYCISDKDFFNPTVIFHIMNVVTSISCCIAAKVYATNIHFNTLIVLVSGMLIFTIVNLVTKIISDKKTVIDRSGIRLRKIEFKGFWVVLFIVFEVLVAFFAIKYVKSVVVSYYGTSPAFSEAIGRYNYIVKNRGEEVRALGVSANPIYSYGLPLCYLMVLVFGAVDFNNYFVTKKHNLPMLIAILIAVVMSFFTGSRSTAFRLFTALIIEFIIISRHSIGSYKKGNFKLIVKLIIIAIVAIIFFSVIINLIGRSVSIDTYQYFVAYLGGPVFNLDTYLQNPYHSSGLFGRETFGYFYKSIGGLINDSNLVYDLNIPYLRPNGIYMGNVYTMYYMFIQDFGYCGIIPLTLFIALFYNIIYDRLMDFRKTGDLFGMKLFIYSYLFNDIIMLLFSNRFYENVLRKTTIKFYFWLVIFMWTYKNKIFSKKIRIGRFILTKR